MYCIEILYLVKEPRKEPFFSILTQATNSRQSNTKRYCRRQFQIDENGRNSAQMDRKYCLKRRSCSLRATSPLPTVFSKDLEKTADT